MKEYLTEFDEMQEALNAVRWDEPVMVYRNGMLMENQDAVCKAQKLLACNEMESSHTFLYDLDLENLDQNDIDRINKLYDVGVKKGYIEDFDAEPEIPEIDKAEEVKAVEPVSQVAPAVPQPAVKVAVPCWTILYSATKDGETKCGECFSNAISVYAAKADCTAKLSRFGYDNISILAIEAGDPDCAGKADAGITCCCEDDLLKNRPHNAHVSVSEAEEKQEEPVAEEKPAEAPTAEEKPAEEAPATEEPAAEEPAAEETNAGDENAAEDTQTEEKPAEDTPAAEEKPAEEKPAEASDEENKVEEKPAELTDEQKSQLKDEYRKAFKSAMLKCKFEERSFNDLTIGEKVQFFETLAKAWTKNDPKDFMSDKELDQLESIETKA